MIKTSTSTSRFSWLRRAGQTLTIAALGGLAIHTAHGSTTAVTVAVMQPGKSTSNAAMSTAMAHYRQGKVSVAYLEFAKLADQGNAEAARIALVMLRYGGTMYGTDWGSSQPQIDRWIRLASQPGEPITSESSD